MTDGLYRVVTNYLCAGFVVANGKVTQCAPILRKKLTCWMTIARRILPMTDLIERLRGVYTLPVNDGAGLLDGKDTFTRTFDVPPIQLEAAAELERLTASVAELERKLFLHENGAFAHAVERADKAEADAKRFEWALLELERLTAWKESQLAVEATWDAQAVGKALDLQLGNDIRRSILPKITALKERAERAEAALEAAPLCGNHAEQWFCAQTVPTTCWICALVAERDAAVASTIERCANVLDERAAYLKKIADGETGVVSAMMIECEKNAAEMRRAIAQSKGEGDG